mmetsp:Transcript_7638/g.30652  ORF Transcript_7638/g.30652 Transcript_7638/m.30652 type:complete len:211 (+) Transcript_7638:603-1235(+)
MVSAAHGLTYAAHGVMVAKPAIAPTQAPTRVGLPSIFHSSMSQKKRAAEAEISEFIAASAACSFAARAEPPLKPNQPNQRRPVPRATKGMLCGLVSTSSPSSFRRLGSATTVAKAEKPAVMCTTMPPAKSLTPLRAIQPPPHTQWANGKYTKCTQKKMNRTYGTNRTRSANAPVIRLGAMTANMPWNPANTSPGIPSAYGNSCVTKFSRK